MKLRYGSRSRKALVALLLLVVAGWLVPFFFSAERYRRRAEAGLERALGRPVTFGAISFHLIPRPGFSVENAVVGEDPAFGAEPFARVDRIDCDLRLRSLWGPRADISRLFLERPSFNVVRNALGDWNLESLLRHDGIAAAQATPGTPGDLQLEADDARMDFMLEQDKKPFAITDVSARLNFDGSRRRVTYRLVGSPVRTDLALPTPGQFELKGEWTPGTDLEGPLGATLQTQGSLLYDWIPVVTGRNPGIYGLVDADVHLAGSFRNLTAEGRIRLSQLHRADQPTPAGTLTTALDFRGRYDHVHGRLTVESLDASFADSHLHVTGTTDGGFSSPALDFVVAVERSRLEDFQALGSRFMPRLAALEVSGRVDGLMTIQGPWTERRYGGFVDIRDARLTTPTGSFPVSEIALRIDRRGARLAPVKISLASRVELLAEGSLLRARSAASAPLRYEFSLTAKAAPLHDLVRFARGVGVKAAEDLDARGTASAAFHFSGPAWPIEPPSVTGQVDLHAARLLIPGLTEPLNLPKAHIQVRDRTITASPVVAVMGTSVFTGRLEHQGGREQSWRFDVRADNLSLEQSSLWFDALGKRAPVPLLQRLPGLRSLVERRAAASSLFSALNAQGRFSTPKLTYRALTLHDFQAAVGISGRVIHVQGATFHAGGGRGKGQVVLDLTQSPARVVADVGVEDARLQPLAPFLPAALGKVRGSYSASGHFETLGLSRQEMSGNLQGRATVRLRNISFGDFDPLQALARATHAGLLEPARGEAALHSAVLTLEVNGRHVIVTSSPAVLSGAQLRLNGTYGFDDATDINVYADLRGLTRPWMTTEGEVKSSVRWLKLHLAGPLDKLAIEPAQELSRVSP